MKKNFLNISILVFFISFISINLVSKNLLCAFLSSFMGNSFFLIKKFKGKSFANQLLLFTIPFSFVLPFYVPTTFFSLQFIVFSLFSLYFSIHVASVVQDICDAKAKIIFMPFFVLLMLSLDTVLMSQFFFFVQNLSFTWIIKKLFTEEMLYKFTLQFLVLNLIFYCKILKDKRNTSMLNKARVKNF